MSDLALLEELAFRSWPAAEVGDCGGWRLRYTSGVSRRANSAWLNGWRSEMGVDHAIDRVEAYYRAHGAAPYFQLGPLAAPSKMDEVLAQRGYVIDAPVRILAADAASMGKASANVRVDETMSSAWFEVSARKGRFAGQEDVYRGILERIADRSGYAIATVDGEPAAVALAVCQPPWGGIFSMSTLAPYRRRGVAASILGAVAAWGRSHGVERWYLQVETENTGACALYARAGFTDVYGYHYRVKR